MTPQTCLYSYNMVGGEYGMNLRPGYSEWALDCETAPGMGDGIHTLMGFDGDVGGTTESRLFAVTREGIWNVTEYDTPPVLMQAFASQQDGAGYGVYSHYVDNSAKDWLLYADELNGLWEYDSETTEWARPTEIEGPNIELVAYVVVHKQRLWLIERNSTVGWYLPVASKQGQADPFYFGAKFKHGGTLRGLYNWTVDGGGGLDDFLVAISGSGDVIPYRGADPSSAVSWQSVGTYYIGGVPRGRNFTTAHVGRLYLLSSFGIISMSDLLRGVNVTDEDDRSSMSYKIAVNLRTLMEAVGGQYGWEPYFLPQQGSLVILAPQYPFNYPPTQWVQNIATHAWGQWRGLSMNSVTELHGIVFFGDGENNIQRLQGTRDAVKITPPAEGFNGDPIKFSLLTSYQDYGAPTQFKIPQLIRPDFFSKTPPSYDVKVFFDYRLTEYRANLQGVDHIAGGVWDTSSWDVAIWGADLAYGQHKLLGASGMGRVMAIAMQGAAVESTRFLSFDVMWKNGGLV
jgi:hypothetical protein